MVGYVDREWWVDYAKTIGIFLVVFIHVSLIGYKNITFSIDKNILFFGMVFHMPLFFFISGYLYKNIKPKIAFVKYFKRLIIPYIFFYFLSIIVIIQQKGLYTDINSIVSAFGKYLGGLILIDSSFNAINANGPIWFLLALFFVICLFSMLKTFLKKDSYILLVILGFNGLLYLLHILEINWMYLSIDSALLGIMFFYVGYISKKHNMMDYFKNNYINVLLAISLSYITYLEFIYNGALNFRGCTWTGNFILSYLGAFTGIIMVISISSILAKFKHRIIYLISISTLTIMGLDQPIRSYMFILFKGGLKTIHPLASAFIITILEISIAVTIAILLNKYAPVLVGNKNKSKLNIHYLKIRAKINSRLRSKY